ncbi:unnamed protein product [Thelazia callipaeda]|uniref:Exportin-T n=1 Tax=Thelazia callipaeda TaxID=103827 RepID=A0A0N5D584_THECL|nr:unnamed protein product [Thelazia callipaeda]
MTSYNDVYDLMIIKELGYIQKLKHDPNGWKKCIQCIQNGCFSHLAQLILGLLIQVLESAVTKCELPCINVLYFEIACRYDKLLQTYSSPLLIILEALFDTLGVLQKSSKPRHHLFWLFYRFVRTHADFGGKRAANFIMNLTPFYMNLSQDSCHPLILKNDEQRLLETDLDSSSIFRYLWNAQQRAIDMSCGKYAERLLAYGSGFVHEFLRSLTKSVDSSDMITHKMAFQILNKLFINASKSDSSILVQCSWDEVISTGVEGNHLNKEVGDLISEYRLVGNQGRGPTKKKGIPK